MKSFNISIKIKPMHSTILDLTNQYLFYLTKYNDSSYKINRISLYLITVAITLSFFNIVSVLLSVVWRRCDWSFTSCIIEFCNQCEKLLGCTGIKYLIFFMKKTIKYSYLKSILNYNKILI